jgi:Cdc6-like AAA superfamily ATPase
LAKTDLIKSIRSRQQVVLFWTIELNTISIGGPFDNFTETVFVDKAVLTESYQPETILERDEEIDACSHALQDVLFGRNPENVFVCGKAGFGKTAVTKYMLTELHEEVRTREAADELHTHTVNCNERTLFMMVRSLFNELIPDHASRFPEWGLGTGDAFRHYLCHIRGATIEICSRFPTAQIVPD